MGTITKNKQSEEKLREIVKYAFGKEEMLAGYKELPDGFCNAAYELTLQDGKSVILKIAPAEGIQMMSCEVEMMRTEVMAMGLAKEHGITGVAKVLVYDNRKKICSGDYFIMEKLEGQGYHIAKQHMTEDEKKEIDIRIGEMLHRIHQIKGEKFGHLCVEELQFSDWHKGFMVMMERIVADGIRANIEIGVPYAEVMALLAEHRPYFAEVTKPELIHFDSWEGNIFVKDGKIAGLIDWERAMWSEGLMEDRFRFHSVNDNFKKGYGLETLTKSQQIRSLWYDVYLYFIMMFEGTYRQYETDEQYRWVRGIFEQVWKQMLHI